MLVLLTGSEAKAKALRSGVTGRCSFSSAYIANFATNHPAIVIFLARAETLQV